MRIKFVTLTLQMRSTRILIDLSSQVSFFHGKIAAGKSSIVRLIDFCLGGSLTLSPALRELVTAELSARIGTYSVVIERQPKHNRVKVSWINDSGDVGRVIAPLDPGDSPIVSGTEVYTLSDLVFYLVGITPPRVRRGHGDSSSELVRLSFRDFMFYCYLNQDDLDSSFFYMEDQFKKLKSRDVMRFVTGFYSPTMAQLESDIESRRKERQEKLEAVRNVRDFLEGFGYASDSELAKAVDQENSKLSQLRLERQSMRAGYLRQTHATDDMRDRLRDLGKKAEMLTQALHDLTSRISEQEHLRSEFVARRVQLGRVAAASIVLSDVTFLRCPSCGSSLEGVIRDEGACPVCGMHPSKDSGEISVSDAEADLDKRIEEIEESLQRHKAALTRQTSEVDEVRKAKTELDRRLKEELEVYESVFLSQAREVEREIATSEERLRGLSKIMEMPAALGSLEDRASALQAEIERLNAELQRERSRLDGAKARVSDVASFFLEALLAVGVPGVSSTDRVSLDTNTWIPTITSSGKQGLEWGFTSAWSGGKKTLFKVCYALAVHQVSAIWKLPLPSLLIIDTPMKNIGEDVDQELFYSFYQYLYGLAASTLADTQFIIIDKEFVAPKISGVEVKSRYMTPDEEAYPPLVPNYRGP